MSVPWFWFAQQLNVLLFYHPYLLLLVLSGFLPPSLCGPTPVTVLSLRSLPLYSKHSELWDSPEPFPEKVDWSFCGHAQGSWGSVASAKEVYSSCMESSQIVAGSPNSPCMHSQAVGRKARKGTLSQGDGWGSLRKGVANVKCVDLSKAEGAPSLFLSFHVSLPRIGVPGGRMRIH